MENLLRDEKQIKWKQIRPYRKDDKMEIEMNEKFLQNNIRGRLKVNKDASIRLQDNIILEHYGLNELNLESVKNYRERFAKAKPNHPWNGLETKDFLYKIGAWGKMRNTSKEGLTLAGLLMFSEERMITEVLPQYFLEYRENLNGIINEQWVKRFTSQDGTWSGNVYDFYFKVMNELSMAPQPMKEIVHEALINALVHADYNGEGGIIVEREQQQFRFSNPGLLRTPIEHVFTSGISNLRNPNLFKMFILINFCKRAGSGLKTIESTCQRYGWEKPTFIQHEPSERTIFTLHVVSFSEGQNEWKSANFVEPFLEWSDEENTIYSINNGPNSVNSEQNSDNKPANSLNKEVKSVNKELNFVNNEPESVNSEPDSLNNELNSVNKADHTEHGDEKEKIEDELWKLAELARKKKRLSPAMMEQIILQLCAKRPLMLKELAHLLERTPDGLRNNYLAKLLAEGKMQLKYPDQPNHPKQAYITKKNESS
jgi:ATP-dependent DNA helicase RecG